jgi:hypothetical protein
MAYSVYRLIKGESRCRPTVPLQIQSNDTMQQVTQDTQASQLGSLTL